MNTVRVALPNGDVEISVAEDSPPSPWATAIIAHGAGSGMDSPFLVGHAEALAAAGIRTLRFNFPYREAGRRMPGPAMHAIAAWRAVTEHAAVTGPVLIGKSYGGRMASMAVAGGLSAGGLVYLGYPLHAPGKPEKPRAEHLASLTQPQLFVEGTKDPFIDPHAQLVDVVDGCQDAQIRWIEGGNHSFEVVGNKRPADVIGAELAPITIEFIRGLGQA